MTKALIPTEKSKNDNSNSFTQQLQTDLGRSVDVTTVTQLVCLNYLSILKKTISMSIV